MWEHEKKKQKRTKTTLRSHIRNKAHKNIYKHKNIRKLRSHIASRVAVVRALTPTIGSGRDLPTKTKSMCRTREHVMCSKKLPVSHTFAWSYESELRVWHKEIRFKYKEILP